MGLIAIADLNTILDDFVLGWQRNNGDATHGLTGSFAALDAAATALGATGNLDVIADLGVVLTSLRDGQDALIKIGTDARAFMARLDRHARRFGGVNFSDLDTLLTYRNIAAGGTWQQLQHPDFRAIYNAIKGTPAVTKYPKPWNLYYEVLQGVVYAGNTFTNALAKGVVAAGVLTFTQGFLIDPALYRGGAPYVHIADLNTGGNEQGIITVTGSAYDPVTQAVTANATWTATVTTQARTALVPGGGNPAAANSSIVRVANAGIAKAANGGNPVIANATIYIEALKPAGRL